MQLEPETADERRNRELRELEGKNIAHYATMLAFYNQYKMENGKTLITLSTVGIGVLVTILTTTSIREDNMLPLLFAGAMLAFFTSILSLIYLLHKKSSWIENDFKRQGGWLESRDADQKWIKRLEHVAIYSFAIAILFCVAIAFASFIPPPPSGQTLRR